MRRSGWPEDDFANWLMSRRGLAARLLGLGQRPQRRHGLEDAVSHQSRLLEACLALDGRLQPSLHEGFGSIIGGRALGLQRPRRAGEARPRRPRVGGNHDVGPGESSCWLPPALAAGRATLLSRSLGEQQRVSRGSLANCGRRKARGKQNCTSHCSNSGINY